MIRRRSSIALAALAVVIVGQPALTARAVTSAVQLRVDQAGYGPGESKQAILMTSAAAGGVRFTVLHGKQVVLSGHASRTDRGSWNATYRHTYALSFSGVHKAGRYTLVADGARVAVTVGSVDSLYRTVLTDGVAFDQVQRDGAHVVRGQLDRQPSHLNDAAASVYATPTFDPDTDEITAANLTKIGGPVDVSGGWFDAGDYLKFTHTAAFADILLLSSARDLSRIGSVPSSLRAEARYGTSWLSKMWRPATKTLYLQVGTGSGTSNGTYLGDHDLWRLPQVDDSDSAAADVYAAAHRPVFEAAAPGAKISPNLAGRVAAAFALAAQVDPPCRAAVDYKHAVQVLGMAATASPPNPLTTALPNDFYPESTWHDDMELGAAEVALAAQRLHRSAAPYLRQAATWAHDYIASDTGDTFNLYDTSALAHVDLVRAMRAAHYPSGLAVTRSMLVADLARQLHGAAAHAAADPFHAAGNVDDFDVDSHTFGLIATAGWYHRLTGRRSYDRFATQERNWLFGTNAWGASFMVGIGSSFPHCMQHQVANLSGSLDGSAPLAVGAVVNGPNNADNFSDGLGGLQDGMRKCSVPKYAAFDGHGSRFVDDVRSWQTDEPALDMTGTAIAAAAAQISR